MKKTILNYARRLPYPIKNILRNILRLPQLVNLTILQPIIKKIRIKQYPGLNLDPIIVYQMGKVGSKTVEQSLIKAYKDLNITIPIYHVHVLNISEQAEKVLRQERADPTTTIAAMNAGKALRRQIEQNQEQHWKLISLVRDPVARNVGTFFHNLHEFIPDWQMRAAQGLLNVDELQNMFINIKTIHNEPQWWFEGQMKKVFGIDVFSSPFPRELGYKLYYDVPRTPLLVLRLEDLNRCGPPAIKEFLSLEDIELVNTNVGEEKDYADVYRIFKKKPLPMEYVEKIYGTKYAHHFYGEDELKQFTQKWTSHAD